MSNLTVAQIQYAQAFEQRTGMDLLTLPYTSGGMTFPECVEYNIELYRDVAEEIASELRRIARENGHDE